MVKKVLVGLLLTAVLGAGAWAFVHFKGREQYGSVTPYNYGSGKIGSANVSTWADAVAKVKEARTEPAAGSGLVIPPELKHYSDRHWFLAAQVAEVEKYKVQTCHDFVELAGMIQRGELVPVPAVTSTYVLYGVGEKVDDGVFTKYEDDRQVGLYSENELKDAYKKLEEKRLDLQSKIASAKPVAAARRGRRTSRKPASADHGLLSLQQELKSVDEIKATLDQFYGRAGERQKLFREYQSLQSLATNFNGRFYELDIPTDRRAFKINMLSALRPEALKILEQVAAAYQSEFDRPLPVSSLVRPEQYQHALNRVNRNAVVIDTPPHSTGLAFDIDYRYMSTAEQTFIMAELARLKKEGRIEAIRERNANYHVFAFVNGVRPSDDLIAESLDKATVEPVQESHHSARHPPVGESVLRRGKTTKPKRRHR
ncbi:MAG: DUF5715 family protein [Pyrinomonadaceae bacterium]